MVEKFLDWRFENNVDAIHNDIETNGLDSPEKFPHGELILRLTNTVVLETKGCEEHGLDPVTIESFLEPSMWQEIDVENYIKFRIYCLVS